MDLKKESVLTKISLCIVVTAIVIITISYFMQSLYYPLGWGAFLWLVPPIFGIPGVIMAILGYKKNKTILARILIIVNAISILCFFGFWIIGYLLEMMF